MIEIRVEVKAGAAKESRPTQDGRYTFHEQKCGVLIVGVDDYPVASRIRLEKDEAAVASGWYGLQASALSHGRYGDVACYIRPKHLSPLKVAAAPGVGVPSAKLA